MDGRYSVFDILFWKYVLKQTWLDDNGIFVGAYSIRNLFENGEPRLFSRSEVCVRLQV